MSQAIVTVTTVVTAYQEESPNRHLRKLGERDSDLTQHARHVVHLALYKRDLTPARIK